VIDPLILRTTSGNLRGEPTSTDECSVLEVGARIRLGLDVPGCVASR
jgi:hypothetical protein